MSDQELFEKQERNSINVKKNLMCTALCVIIFGGLYFAGVYSGRDGWASRDIDQLVAQYRESEQRARDTVEELTKQIDVVRARANYSEQLIKDARGLCEQALSGIEDARGNISKAISISRVLTEALRDLLVVLSGGSPASVSYGSGWYSSYFKVMPYSKVLRRVR